jgi:2-polyprenyl-3-methyl-5-hydroxy-6-metoxy-1,4-benzoquinol methylase
MFIDALKRHLSGYPLAVRLKKRLDSSFGFSYRMACRRNLHLEVTDRKVIVDRIAAYYRDELGLGEATSQEWLCSAFNFALFQYDLDLIRDRFGALSGKRVADIGCGWGSFLLLLAREGALVEACDIGALHSELAALRVPSARVTRADARDLTGFASDGYDFVIEHDVLEHIGDYSGDTGPMGRSYRDKLLNLKELARILKPGGRGFLSTGNYQFPFNGEVNLWFLHWFPFEHQQRYLKSLGMDSDRYWLCTWEELRSLFDEAGLVIDEVTTPLHDVLAFQKRIMSHMKKDPTVNDSFAEIIKELMMTRPEYMPTWKILFRKK